MLFFNLFAAAAAVIGASAASIAPRARHVADFRVFGAPGCSEKNLGVWTVIDSDIKTGECKGFKNDVIHSVTTTDIHEGCVLHVFTDDECTTGTQTVQQGQCGGASDALKGWKVSCA